MKTFDVRVKKASGYESLQISAENINEARLMVPGSGRIISIKETPTRLFNRGMKSEDRIIFLERLALMVESGVGLSKSLDLINKNFTGHIQEVARTLAEKVRDGSDIVLALQSMPEHFPKTSISLIRSGVHGGSLSDALKQAADFEREMAEVDRETKKGMLAATFEFALGVSLIIACAFFLIPWLEDSSMPTDSKNFQMAVTFTYWLAAFAILLGFAGAVIVLITKFMKPIFPDAADRIIIKIPSMSEIVLSKGYFSTFFGLYYLIQAGVRFSESLSLAAQSAPKGVIKSDIERAVKAAHEGKDWAGEMINLDETDKACLQTSMDRSEVSKTFLAIANSHKLRYAQKMQWLTGRMSFVSNIFLALAGFLIFILTFLPGVDAASSVM